MIMVTNNTNDALENLLLGEDYTAHTIGDFGHTFAVKFTDVFMTVRAEAGVVLVEPEIKGGVVLNHCLIER